MAVDETARMLGGIWLSCGCRYEACMGDFENLSVRYKDETCDSVDGFQNAVAYAVWCPECRKVLEREGLLIETDEQEREWLEGARNVGS